MQLLAFYIHLQARSASYWISNKGNLELVLLCRFSRRSFLRDKEKILIGCQRARPDGTLDITGMRTRTLWSKTSSSHRSPYCYNYAQVTPVVACRAGPAGAFFMILNKSHAWCNISLKCHIELYIVKL